MEDEQIEKIKEDIKNALSAIDNMMKYLIIFMILLVSFKVVIAVINGKIDVMGIAIGIGFTLFLIALKWVIKEMGM